MLQHQNKQIACSVVRADIHGFIERRELDICVRRYMIPYIDIGMAVHYVGEEPRLCGRVILSMSSGLAHNRDEVGKPDKPAKPIL